MSFVAECFFGHEEHEGDTKSKKLVVPIFRLALFLTKGSSSKAVSLRDSFTPLRSPFVIPKGPRVCVSHEDHEGLTKYQNKLFDLSLFNWPPFCLLKSSSEALSLRDFFVFFVRKSLPFLFLSKRSEAG
jgi:hypothetical protein